MRTAALLLWFVISSAWAGGDRVSVVLGEVAITELLRVVYVEIAPEPFVLAPEVLESRERVTVDLRQVTRPQVVAAVAGLVQAAGFEVVKRGGVVWIGRPGEAPEEIIVYKPKHRRAGYLADVVQSVTSARSVMSRSNRNPNVSEPIKPMSGGQGGQNASMQTLKQISPTSVEGQIDRSEVDQIAFTVAAKDSGKVRKLLADLDTPTGEVVLKAAVYEVGYDRREGSALKIAASLFSDKLLASIAGDVLSGVSIKFAFGGFAGVLSALDADVRFKSISRPQVRVKNGAQARFTVGQDVPVLSSSSLDNNGNAIQSVEYKQSGVILTATPEIRQDVIELNLHQELSNFVVTKTGVNNSPTLTKRAVETRLGMVPGEVVMLAGLQDDQDDQTENRIPWLKWVVGQDVKEKRSEILIFLEVIRI